MEDSITLSEKYGVNPSIELCLTCGKEMGVVLFGNSYKEDGVEKEAPKQICIGNLCEECMEIVHKGGIWVVPVDDNKQPLGGSIALRRDAALRLFGDEIQPVCCVDKEVFNTLLSIYEKTHDAGSQSEDNGE